MKICEICKKEYDHKWKYCSNKCIVEATNMAKNEKKLFLQELELELLPSNKYFFDKRAEKEHEQEIKDYREAGILD